MLQITVNARQGCGVLRTYGSPGSARDMSALVAFHQSNSQASALGELADAEEATLIKLLEASIFCLSTLSTTGHKIPMLFLQHDPRRSKRMHSEDGAPQTLGSVLVRQGSRQRRLATVLAF